MQSQIFSNTVVLNLLILFYTSIFGVVPWLEEGQLVQEDLELLCSAQSCFSVAPKTPHLEAQSILLNCSLKVYTKIKLKLELGNINNHKFWMELPKSLIMLLRFDYLTKFRWLINSTTVAEIFRNGIYLQDEGAEQHPQFFRRCESISQGS